MSALGKPARPPLATDWSLHLRGLYTQVRILQAIPRSFNVGTTRYPPLHLSGVSDNMFKDMMADSGGQLPARIGGEAGGQQSRKKVKDKKNLRNDGVRTMLPEELKPSIRPWISPVVRLHRM